MTPAMRAWIDRQLAAVPAEITARQAAAVRRAFSKGRAAA